MNRVEIGDKVCEQYKRRYPQWTDVHVTEMVIDTFGGNLAIIAYKTEKGTESDEMCFIDPEGDVRIFSTTEECVRFLEQKAKAPLLERIFTRPVMSGVVFVFLLVAVFIVGFFTNFRPEALSILGSVVGVAAGFFFGSGKAQG